MRLRKKPLHYEKLRLIPVFKILIILTFSRVVFLKNCVLITKIVHDFFTDDKDNLKRYQKTVISPGSSQGKKLITTIIIEINLNTVILSPCQNFLLHFNIIHHPFLKKIYSCCFGTILKAIMDQGRRGSGFSSKVFRNIKGE